MITDRELIKLATQNYKQRCEQRNHPAEQLDSEWTEVRTSPDGNLRLVLLAGIEDRVAAYLYTWDGILRDYILKPLQLPWWKSSDLLKVLKLVRR